MSDEKVAAPGGRATVSKDRAGALGRRAFLWRAVHADRPGKELYLFGSVHVGTADFYPLDRVVTGAFERADALVVEVAIERLDPAQAALTIATRATLQGGETLRDRISVATWKQVRAALDLYGIPEQLVLPFEPWYVALTLLAARMVGEGLSPELGLDRHFVERAQGSKPVLELESLELQLGLFDGLDPEVQELMLLDAVAGDVQSGGALESLMAAWRAGDAAALDAELRATLGEDARFAPLYRSIITDRNHRMAARMVELLEQRERLFVVVGAGHLVGVEGIPQLLAARGWSVVQLENEGR